METWPTYLAELEEDLREIRGRRRADGWDPVSTYGNDGEDAPTVRDVTHKISGALARAPAKKGVGVDLLPYEFLRGSFDWSLGVGRSTPAGGGSTRGASSSRKTLPAAAAANGAGGGAGDQFFRWDRRLSSPNLSISQNGRSVWSASTPDGNDHLRGNSLVCRAAVGRDPLPVGKKRGGAACNNLKTPVEPFDVTIADCF